MQGPGSPLQIIAGMRLPQTTGQQCNTTSLDTLKFSSKAKWVITGIISLLMILTMGSS